MTVAKNEYLTAFQEILTLNIKACTVEVCIASLPVNEPQPNFKRLRLAESLKDGFRDLVAACLVEYHKDLLLHNLQLLEFDVASKPAGYQIEHLDLSKKPYDNIVEQTQPLKMLHGL